LLQRFDSSTAKRADFVRLVRELNSIADDVNTRPDLEPVQAQRSEAAAELIRLGVLYYVCTECGKPTSACHCLPQRAATKLVVDAATLATLAALPTD
jgi:hypothetical protein